MKVKLRMTYDQSRKMAQYLNAYSLWPEWEFPGMEIEFYDPDPDVDDGEMQIIFLKKCSVCKKELPNTSQYFYESNSKRVKAKDGLVAKCKDCYEVEWGSMAIAEGFENYEQYRKAKSRRSGFSWKIEKDEKLRGEFDKYLDGV